MSSGKGDVSQADKSFMGMPVSSQLFLAISGTIVTATHLNHRGFESLAYALDSISHAICLTDSIESIRPHCCRYVAGGALRPAHVFLCAICMQES